MDIEEMERKKVSARGRMHRADRARQILLSKLCHLNAEFQNAREEYYRLDRKIAEQHIEQLPPPGKGSKSKPKGIESELEDLSAEQIGMLKARIEQMKEEQKQTQQTESSSERELDPEEYQGE